MANKKTNGWLKFFEVLLVIVGALFAVFATKKAKAKSTKSTSKKVTVKTSKKKSSKK
jgi:hypothetical protein